MSQAVDIYVVKSRAGNVAVKNLEGKYVIQSRGEEKIFVVENWAEICHDSMLRKKMIRERIILVERVDLIAKELFSVVFDWFLISYLIWLFLISYLIWLFHHATAVEPFKIIYGTGANSTKSMVKSCEYQDRKEH